MKVLTDEDLELQSGRSECVLDVVDARPDSAQHVEDALSSNPALNAVPDASHDGSIEYGPKSAPDTERRTTDNRKSNVVHGTDATSRGDEATRDCIADPYAYPCLPPTKTVRNHRCCDHPGIDIEAISDPEADIVPGTPLTSLWFYWLEVVVRQHKLAGG